MNRRGQQVEFVKDGVLGVTHLGGRCMPCRIARAARRGLGLGVQPRWLLYHGIGHHRRVLLREWKNRKIEENEEKR